MAARRSSTVCLSCRYHTSVSTSRRIQHSVKRNLQTATLQHSGGEQTTLQDADTGERREVGTVQSITDAIGCWTTQTPMADVREAVLALEVMVKQRDRRQEVLRSLCKSRHVVEQDHSEPVSVHDKFQLPEAQAGPLSRAKYNELMGLATSMKHIRQVLRAQLLQVRYPKDILRVAAVALQNRTHAEQLATLEEPIMRALYRCRETVNDAEVLGACNAIITRLHFVGLVPRFRLLTVGMKFAARARSLHGMKKYLKLVREHGTTMTCNLFRAVIAKFSIGDRGLGEIRNGRWRRADLMQVLTGFEDCRHLPPSQQYHLGVFLDREDWQYLHGWVAVLGRCKASDEVWAEWLLWKQNSGRTNPRRIEGANRYMDTQVRGDNWFIEQMVHTGDLKRAWRVLEDTTIPFASLKARVKSRLMDSPEHSSSWTPQLTEAMLDKYDAELSQIERAFGVTWQSGIEDGEGQHILFRDQEEALDELSVWRAEEDFGFPVDDDTSLSTQEQHLHDALGSTPVSQQI